MTEYTAADLKQNAEINANTHRIAKLEQDQLDLTSKLEAALRLQGTHTGLLGDHERKLNLFDPLRVLIEHVEAIRNFIVAIKERIK